MAPAEMRQYFFEGRTELAPLPAATSGPHRRAKQALKTSGPLALNYNVYEGVQWLHHSVRPKPLPVGLCARSWSRPGYHFALRRLAAEHLRHELWRAVGNAILALNKGRAKFAMVSIHTTCQHRVASRSPAQFRRRS
jgi:hypothetical protein